MNETKEHILTVSLYLFLEKSFKEVTMKEIEQKTGLSKGAFYHYFSSKEQVFEEVMNHFYTDLMTTDYSTFSSTSLQQFCSDSLNEKHKKISASKVFERPEHKHLASNLYYLLFDAMKMLPGFNKKYEEQQKEDLKAWIKIIRTAKKSGEIKSVLSDEQIAKLFIHSRKGVSISCIVSNHPDTARKEVKSLWDNLYKSMKN